MYIQADKKRAERKNLQNDCQNHKISYSNSKNSLYMLNHFFFKKAFFLLITLFIFQLSSLSLSLSQTDLPKQPYKIAILYIATGRYITFWDEFYESSEQMFLSNCPKDYFVFTDQKKFKYQDHKNVHVVHQKQLGWPYDTLLRFKMFLRIEERLKKYDYIFFFNANAKIVMPIGKEILPDGNFKLMMSVYPTYYEKDKSSFPYDRNPKSTAYIPMEEGSSYYVQGTLNGGKTKAYIDMLKTCDKQTKIDLKNHVIATVHDESHLNKYIQNRDDVMFLKPFYMFPEEQKTTDYNFQDTQPLKILIRDKQKLQYGGHSHLRGAKKKSFIDKTKCYIYKKFKFFFIDTLGLCHLESNKNCIPILNIDDEKLFPKE